MTIERRRFCTLLASSLSTPFILTSCGGSGGGNGETDARVVVDDEVVEDPDTLITSNLGNDFAQDPDQQIFDISIASGDPTPNGVILWTHISTDAANLNLDLHFQVAVDEHFEQLVVERTVISTDITALRDNTVKVDLEGLLKPDRHYHYRFIYNNVKSRVGRCRTAPKTDASPDKLKFGLLTCQDYTNGYYGALKQVAEDDSLDFIIHLGDFIYESVGDPSYQPLNFEDRKIILPSERVMAMDLEDYRKLYRTYRSDQNLQKAMERHTWIMTTDDHETANDCYWDYANDTLGAPDHHYTTSDEFTANQYQLLNRLKLDAQEAWLEYVPARVTVNFDSTDPHRFLKIYRHLVFGDLLELFMLDTRSYRTGHACGEGRMGDRYLPLGCDTFDQTDTPNGQPHSILGKDQKDWLYNGLFSAKSRYKVLGNQTLMGRLGVEHKGWQIPFNMDAWDGYQQERDELMQEIMANKVENFVVLTGDLHTHIASNVKVDYRRSNPSEVENYVGVEFMTPATTSSALIDMINGFLDDDLEVNKQAIINSIATASVMVTNPHIRFFNSREQGYSTVLFTPDYAEWESFVIDKSIRDSNTKTQVARFKKHVDKPWLQSESFRNAHTET